jgi:type III secretory pathway component EscR
MIKRYVLDFEETFVNATLLKIEPKMERSNRDDPKSPMEHAHDKDGVPKYTAFLSVETKNFEKTQFDNITVTVTSQEKLDEVMPTNVYVTLEELEMGVMKNERSGFTIYYSARAIKPLPAKQVVQTGQSTHGASGQVVPPARAASGQ